MKEKGAGRRSEGAVSDKTTAHIFIKISTRVTFAVESVSDTWARLTQNFSLAVPELWRLAGIRGCVRLARRLPVKRERALAERCLKVLAWNEALLARMSIGFSSLRRRR